MFILPQSAPPAAGGGAPWSIAGSWTYSADVANVDFTNLGSYNELMVILRKITASASGYRALLCSTDNGSTYRSNSGDYVGLDINGNETNIPGVSCHVSATTSAVSGVIRLVNPAMNGVAKVLEQVNNNAVVDLFVQSTAPVNALRVVSIGANGNLTGGSIQVLGR